MGAWFAVVAPSAARAQTRGAHTLAPGDAPLALTAERGRETVATTSSGAIAPEPRPVAPALVVAVASALPAGLRAAAVRDAIARELEWTAVAPDAPEAAHATARLRVRFDPRRARVVVEFRDALAHRVRRDARLPRAPSDALETVAFLAGNLARDEALDVVAALTLRRRPRGAHEPGAPDRDADADAARDAADDTAGTTGTSDAAASDTAHVHAGLAVGAPLRAFAVDPETLALALDPPEARAARARLARVRAAANAGSVALVVGASAGGGVSSALPALAWNVGLTVRWRGLAVRLDATHAALRAAGPAGGGGRVWVCPLLAAVIPAGPFVLELGAGVGAVVSTAALLPGSVVAWRPDVVETAPAARAALSAALPINRALDLTARLDAHLGVVSTVVNGLENYRPVAAQVTAMVGVQGRWNP